MIAGSAAPPTPLQKAYDDGRWLAAWDATAGKVATEQPTPPTIDRY